MKRPKLIYIFLLALVARVIVTLLFGENTLLKHEYMTIAQNLLDGKGYSWDEWGRAPLQVTSFLPPLYVYWCLFFQSFLSHDYTIMFLAQAIVSSLSIFVAYVLGKKMFNQQTGWTFALLIAIYPEFIFLHSRPVTEFLYLWLGMVLAIGYLDLKSSSFDRAGLLLAAKWGVLCGITILVKESAILLIVALGLALLWQRRIEWKNVIVRIGTPSILVMLLVMSPWMIRNYVVQKEFIPIRTGFGITAWIANHPGATGTDKRRNGDSVLATQDTGYLAYMKSILPPDEQDRDKVYFAEAKKFARENPREYMRLTLTRLRYFVFFDETHPLAKNLLYRISWIALLITGLTGAILAKRHRMLEPAIGLSIGLLALLYVPVLILPRYRLIPVMWMLLLTAYLITCLVSSKKKSLS